MISDTNKTLVIFNVLEDNTNKVCFTGQIIVHSEKDEKIISVIRERLKDNASRQIQIVSKKPVEACETISS